MRGHDMTWAAFHVIEVIANQKFGAKRVGYLAASQSFSETTDVIMLITNLIRKVRFECDLGPLESVILDFACRPI
jgi:AP-3 complex subunit delta-1